MVFMITCRGKPLAKAESGFTAENTENAENTEKIYPQITQIDTD
jgi:hypothetical protein